MPKAHCNIQSTRRTNRLENGDALLRAVYAHHTRQRHRRFVVALAPGQRRQARTLRAQECIHACAGSSPSRCAMGASAKARVYLAGSVIHGHASALLQLLQHVALAHFRGLSHTHTTLHSRPERSMATGAHTRSGVASVSPLSRTNAPWQPPSGRRTACLARCQRRPASPRARLPRWRSTNTCNRPLSMQHAACIMHPAHAKTVSTPQCTVKRTQQHPVRAHVVVQAHRRHQRPNTLLKAVLPEVFLRLVRTAHDDHVVPVYTYQQTISSLFSIAIKKNQQVRVPKRITAPVSTQTFT